MPQHNSGDGGAILIADDHPLFRQALGLAVMGVRPDADIIEAGTIAAALEVARNQEGLALILLDLHMPGAEGFMGIALMHAQVPDVPIIVVSSADAANAAREARRVGAVGFLGKHEDLATMEQVIAAALAGEKMAAPADEPLDAMASKLAELTPMQLQVLHGVLAGRLNKQIAHDLGIALPTVKAHMTAVLRKLDVANRTQAVLAARALGLQAPD
ncbi:MAG: response regulator transcription factor [Sphingomonadales bacterium]|nr:MAG: response regulator transcription factor [Sphingomonadales bacterium]TNF06232.1 MAG: response regulator transcription factor [Sphingomonadales bacterium]